MGISGAWQSALIAAATAALVTLLVEYSAKPWLEVRKARILDEAHAFREIQASLKRILVLLGSARQPQVIELAPVRVMEDLVEIRQIVRDVQRQLAYVRSARIESVFGRTLGLVIGRIDAACMVGLAALQTDDLTVEQKVQAMSLEPQTVEALTCVSDYILTPRTKLVGRVRHFTRMVAAARGIQPPDRDAARA